MVVWAVDAQPNAATKTTAKAMRGANTCATIEKLGPITRSTPYVINGKRSGRLAPAECPLWVASCHQVDVRFRPEADIPSATIATNGAWWRLLVGQFLHYLSAITIYFEVE